MMAVLEKKDEKQSQYENMIFKVLSEHKEFSRLVFKLSAKVHISVDDARSILLSQLFDKVEMYQRNKHKTSEEIYSILQADNEDTRYFINYTIYNAYKEALTQVLDFKDHIRINRKGKICKLETVELNEEITADMSQMNISVNLDEIIDIIYKCLSKSAAEFASYLLLHGAEETMEYYEYTSMSSISRRIRSIETTMEKKRPKYRHLLLSPMERHMKHDLDTLTQLTDLLDSADYTDLKFSDLLNQLQNVTIVTDLLADNVHHIVYFIQNFGRNGSEDYEFINALYREKDRLKRRLQNA